MGHWFRECWKHLRSRLFSKLFVWFCCHLGYPFTKQGWIIIWYFNFYFVSYIFIPLPFLLRKILFWYCNNWNIRILHTQGRNQPLGICDMGFETSQWPSKFETVYKRLSKITDIRSISGCIFCCQLWNRRCHSSIYQWIIDCSGTRISRPSFDFDGKRCLLCFGVRSSNVDRKT